LIGGRRAVPLYWRAYDASVLKGRMKRYELAVIRRAVGRVVQAVGKRRGGVTAARGCADVALFPLLSQLGGNVHHPGESWPPRRLPGPVAQVGAMAVSGA